MTDFQLGLLVIGAAVIAGVALYNRLQERSVRRQAQRAFGSGHADVLLETAPGRQEPMLESPHARGPGIQSDAMPDSRVDYVINLDTARGVAASLLLAEWGTLEHRFAKLAALATFLLLVIGGTVNPTGSSLACPEPTIVCDGQLFPPMVGGVL